MESYLNWQQGIYTLFGIKYIAMGCSGKMINTRYIPPTSLLLCSVVMSRREL